ncbi:hypothetical protein ACQP1W_48350 [Spirillospora sp. CA-255316]
MQPAPIRDGARRAPDPVPHARATRLGGTLPRVLLRGSARVAVAAGLAFAGWFLLSALAGSPASAAATDPAGHGGEAGRSGPALTAGTERASGEMLARTTARAAARTAARAAERMAPRTAERMDAWRLEGVEDVARGPLLRAPSSTVARLVDEVSDRSGLRELRPAGAALMQKAGLPDDRRAVDRLLSPLTAHPPALGTLLGTGRATALQAAHDDAGVQAPPAGARGEFAVAAPGVRSGASPSIGCRSCSRAGHGPFAPQPLMPPGQGDASAAFLHTGHGPGPMTATFTSPIGATPATVDVRSHPAAAMRDKSAPARPMVVPD